MTDARRLRVADFAYDLPSDAVAQTPAEPRDASRLLVLERGASAAGQPALRHRRFAAIGQELRAGDLLVVNDSRVIPARLSARRAGGGAAEVLLLRPLDDGRWEALVHPSARLRDGARLTLRNGAVIEVGERLGDGTRAVNLGAEPEAPDGRRRRATAAALYPRPVRAARALPDHLRPAARLGGGTDGGAALHRGAAVLARRGRRAVALA